MSEQHLKLSIKFVKVVYRKKSLVPEYKSLALAIKKKTKFDQIFRDLQFLLFDSGVCLPCNKKLKLKRNQKPTSEKIKLSFNNDLYKSLNYVHLQALKA